MTRTKTKTEASAPKRRRADAERNIASITNAALEALASDPDVSMAEIARRAGVVRATIYVHFPTRESLLDAVMEHATAQVADATRAAEPSRGEPAAPQVGDDHRSRTQSVRPSPVAASRRKRWSACSSRLGGN